MAERTTADTLCTPRAMVSAAMSGRLPRPHLPDRPGHGHALSRWTTSSRADRPRRGLRHPHQRPLRLAQARPDRADHPGLLRRRSGSTNGTFVNDVPASICQLKDGDYLRVGNCIYRFLAGGNVEAEYHEEIYRLTIIDGLTDIHNKRYLMEFLDRELSRSDPLQPAAGADHVRHRPLQERSTTSSATWAATSRCARLAACVKAVIRKEELFARYGGEEFAVVLPEGTRADGRRVGERVREIAASTSFRFDDVPISVTVSVGVACLTDGEEVTPQELIERADARLYEAKRAGRNRVVC